LQANRAPKKSRLAWRVYGFTAIISIAIMAALLLLPRYTRSARYQESQAALIQFLVERWSSKNPQEFHDAVTRIAPRLRGRLTVYASDGKQVWANDDEALEPPNAAEKATVARDKWSLDWGRIVVRSDDGSMIGVYAPNRPGFPWSWVLPIGAIILVVVGGASMWFARRLAIPLDRLANAARRFGAGDVRARAELHRDDEVGQVGKAFDDMAERTANVMSAQRQLMADVSHELRTPLARIRVALELATEDPVGAKDVLADVSGDLDEIDQLIGDILTTARLDGQRSAMLNLTPTRVADLADRAAQRFVARHPGRVLDKRGDHASDHVVDCDPVLLRRAIDNLLDNAAKYSDKDQPVTFAIENGSPERVAFAIIDKGIGMSAEDLEHAFTPFWRADGSRTRKTGGVGLGLALARRIALAHGGDVTLKSTKNQGTTATLVTPIAS
jgi:signal transduction histidine kinase